MTTKLDKLKRYDWKIQDAPGHLLAIPKASLLVDYEYQRETIQHRVLEIAKDWSWIACGTITVAKRGGFYYVVDGQHRVLAAQQRSDIGTLPCIVFNTTTKREEAQGFLTTQTKRKAVSAVEQFKPKLMTGDPFAFIVNDLANQSGRAIANYSSGNTISCVGILMRLAERKERELRRVWPLMVSLCEGHGIPAHLIDGLVYLESRMPNGESMTDPRWRKRLMDVGFKRLEEGIRSAAAYYKSGGARISAEGMLNEINHGLRYRLELADDSTEVAS